MTPTRRGFDKFLGYYFGMEDYWNHSVGYLGAGKAGYDFHHDIAGEPLVPGTGYAGNYSLQVFRDEAVRIISSHDATKPMYMYLALQNVHCPNQAPQKYLDQYSHVTHMGRRIHNAMITAMDDTLGDIVAALRAKNMWDISERAVDLT